MFAFLIDVQRQIHAALASHLSQFAETGSWGFLLAILPMGVVFGAAHALTPGHSKSILASYIVSSEQRPFRAAMTSLILSATHIASAILLAVVANTLVTRTLVGAGRAPLLEYTSRLMLAAIGLWLIGRAIYGKPHVHGEGPAVGMIAGLVPCPLTLFVMTFAMSRGVPEAGLMFSLSMFAGVGLVLAVIAVSASLARHLLTTAAERSRIPFRHVGRALEIAAGAALLAISLFEITR